jgi:hypothetical protein
MGSARHDSNCLYSTNWPYLTPDLEDIISTYTSNLLLNLTYAFAKERGLNNKVNNISSALKLSPF